jgi:spore germination cell wall hydrolase CwlJ-like protein
MERAVPSASVMMKPLSPPVPNPHYTATRALALTMWAEARSDGAKGMRAVGHVIMNRVNSVINKKSGYILYGKDIKGVVHQPLAFSVWNEKNPNKRLMTKLGNNINHRPSFILAMSLAQNIIDGTDKDNTGGATHFHTINSTASWSKDAEPTKQIGSHIFYKNVDKFASN